MAKKKKHYNTMIIEEKDSRAAIDDIYVEDNANNTSEADLDKAIENESDINRKISKSGALEKYAELGKLMLAMLKDYRKGLYKNVPWFTIASIAFALLYVLNPLDIVPDFIPGLGYIDDLSVLSIALRFIETDLHSYLDWKIEHTEEKANPTTAFSTVPEED